MSEAYDIFEVMCISSIDFDDSPSKEKKIQISKKETFVNYLLSIEGFWLKSKISGSHDKIIDRDLGVMVDVDQFEGCDIDDSELSIITAKISGKSEILDEGRGIILKHLDSANCFMTYVITDQVSQSHAATIYPKINNVENSLRRYIVKFFVTKFGRQWWDITAANEMSDKVNNRKKQINIFDFESIDNRIYGIDFKDLGQLIHSQRAGFNSQEDIIERVKQIKDMADLNCLVEELQSNYTKFFKENFYENQFQDKWQKLESIRHKVAHNSYLRKSDCDKVDELSESLLSIIAKADASIESFEMNEEDKSDVREYLLENSESEDRRISKDVFLNELQKMMSWSRLHANDFVALSHFKKEISKNYSLLSINQMIYSLEKEGLILIKKEEFDENPNPITTIVTSASTEEPRETKEKGFQPFKDIL